MTGPCLLSADSRRNSTVIHQTLIADQTFFLARQFEVPVIRSACHRDQASLAFGRNRPPLMNIPLSHGEHHSI